MRWWTPLYPLRKVTGADIASLQESGDARGLVRLLSARDPEVQAGASAALVRMGPSAREPLLSALGSARTEVRLGAVEALAGLRDPEDSGALARVLAGDAAEEVRWAAALALGESGDPGPVPALVRALHDPDKYVRLGAAEALGRLGWEPAAGQERVDLLIARQDWDHIPAEGEAATGPLTRILGDRDPQIRARVVDTLGLAGHRGAAGACSRALGDPESMVRWRATLAFPRCGVQRMHLPLGISHRPKTGKHPAVAVFLNLFFPGLGYNYLGAWWGLICFQTIVTFVVLLSLAIGPVLPTVLQYSLSSLIALQTWLATRTLPREDPM